MQLNPENDRGATMALFALLLVVILLTATLVLDFGNAAQRKRQEQATTDNSALAGAQDLPDSAAAIAVAADYAASNLGLVTFGSPTGCGDNATCYSAGGWNLTITTPYQGSTTRIQARLCRSVPSVFGQVIGVGSWNVCTSSAARYSPAQVGADVMVLDPHASNAFVCSGSCSVQTGSIVVDSDNTKALVQSGGSSITADVIGIVGLANISGGATLTCPDDVPCPATGPDQFRADPYASVPDLPEATVQAQYGAGQCTTAGSVTTCTPGVYSSKLTVSGGNTGVFQPGIYYLKAGLTISSSPASGSNVLFYNAAPGDKFTISGGSPASFTPLNDGGAYSAFVLFQEDGNTSKATLSGGSAMTFPGIVYNPKGLTELSGGSSSGAGFGQIVTNTLVISGPSNIGGGSAGGGAPVLELYE